MTAQEIMKQQLTPAELQKIERFTKDSIAFNAVKKVVLSSIYSHGVIQKGLEHDPLQNGAFSLAALSTNNPIPNEQLGEHIRAMWAGVNAMENGFRLLASLKAKEEEVVESPYNEAE